MTGPQFPEALPARRQGDAWVVEVDGREVRLSNLTKPYWPADGDHPGYTKGDLLTYYWNVADLVLPHLRDRPLTLHRMPEGLTGAPFYEKQVPRHAPDWIRTAAVPSEGGKREVIDFVMAQDRASLLWVVNLGCIELHPLHSRVPSLADDADPDAPAGALDRPDYAFFDLDPFEPYTFADVRAVAKLVKVVLDGLGLRGYPKTSGATGMQVFVPLDGSHTYADARALVQRVGELMVRAWPEKVTMAWPVAERAGKVFIDHQMNRRGANIASVYSVRPRPGAPVSTPLDWEELDEDIEPGDFTMTTVWERFAAGDRFAGVLTDRQSLRPAMEALGLAVDTPPRRREGTTGRSRWGTGRRDLADYRRKRDFSRTPEPAPTDPDAPEPPAPAASDGERPARPAGVDEPAPLAPGRRFVIQQHHARRLHHDVRFERDGVLVSFAVPKRLPEEPGVRHLAVNTEDHPLEYLTFSGEIPSGEYGAGQVRLFDLGTYETVEARDGKLTVRLFGSRYHGAEYHFIRTGGEDGRDWICFLAGRTSLPQPAAPPAYAPMLATPATGPFDDDDWLFEVKWDGHRCLATLDASGGTTRLVSRTGRDCTTQFPELEDLHRQLAARNAVVDGEVAALDERGRPSFERMQDRFHRAPDELRRALAGRREHASGWIPVQYLAFDLLWLDGRPLIGEPLERRQALLAEVLVPNELVVLTTPVRGKGVAFFEQARALGLEGVMAKRAASTYQPGRRSPDWRKVKAVRRQDCVIVGWTDGQGGRASTLGALLVAVATPEGLVFAGNVGTGFNRAILERLMPELRARATDRPPVVNPPRVRGAHWVRPELVCEVEYLAWTREGRLRAPSFKGLRWDKAVEDAIRE